MTKIAPELKTVRASFTRLDRRSFTVVVLLIVFSCLVGITQSAALWLESFDHSLSPAESARLQTRLAPWRSDAWSARALYSRDPDEIEQALKVRLMLSPVSSEEWVRLAKHRLSKEAADTAGGLAALREAFDVAPRSPSLDRLRFALSLVTAADATLDVAIRRDLKWALAEAGESEALVAELAAQASSHGKSILSDEAANANPAAAAPKDEPVLPRPADAPLSSSLARNGDLRGGNGL